MIYPIPIPAEIVERLKVARLDGKGYILSRCMACGELFEFVFDEEHHLQEAHAANGFYFDECGRCELRSQHQLVASQYPQKKQ